MATVRKKKSSEYKFSVLMSICDKETPKYIKECLDSVFNQTVVPDEVVVVLDGLLAKDSMKILDNYDLKIIKNKHMVGLSNALNQGLKKCKYEIVARMDSDDICVKNRFEKQLEEFKKNNNLALVGGQILEFEDDITYKVRRVPLTREEIIKFSKKRNPFNHMTVMFKKSVILSLGSYEVIPYFEDYYLWTKLLNGNYEVKNLEDVLVNARINLDHIKRRGEIKYIKYIYNFEKRIYKDGYINFFQFIFNIIVRFLTSILPNRTRSKFYNMFLRK